MKRIALAALALGCAGSAAASAQIATPTIRLMFSTTAPGANLTTVPEDILFPPSVPVLPPINHVAPGTTVYLYAMVHTPSVWNRLAFGATGSAGVLTLANPVLDPVLVGEGIQRWNPGGDFTLNLDGSDYADVSIAPAEGFTFLGLQHPYSAFDAADPLGLQLSGGAAGRSLYYLGSVSPETPGEVFLTIGGGITHENGPPPPGSPIFFGNNDPAVLGQSPWGTSSTLPDLIIVPEPGTGCVLVLAALSLRRVRPSGTAFHS